MLERVAKMIKIIVGFVIGLVLASARADTFVFRGFNNPEPLAAERDSDGIVYLKTICVRSLEK